MQFQQQEVASTASMRWIGDELLTIVQASMFLVLGYAVTRAFQLFSAGSRMPVKKMDGEDELPSKQNDKECEEEEVVVSSRSKADSRRANARDRKRTRTVKSLELKEPMALVIEAEPVANEPVQEEATEVAIEQPASVEETTLATPVKVTKKRKARKVQVQKESAQQIAVGKAATPVVSASLDVKSDSDSLSQDDQSPGSLSMASTASTLSMVSTGVESCESEASLSGVQLNDDSTNDADSQTMTVEAPSVELQEPSVSADTIDVELVEEDGENMQNEVVVSQNAPCHVNFDDIMSDSDSDAEEIQDCVPMQGDVQGVAELANPPVVWCDAPVGTQIDGWVAVAVPTQEYEKPGAFDGIWKNNEGEIIVIDKVQITLESGVVLAIKMQSSSNLSVDINSEEYSAQCEFTDGVGMLRWSDGDVWTYQGQVQEAAADMWTCQAGADMWPCEAGANMWPCQTGMEMWTCEAVAEVPPMTMPIPSSINPAFLDSDDEE